MNLPERNQTNDLLRALKEADALDNFQALPLKEQERFWDWIAKSRDEEGYWRRIEILVMGMRMAPPIKAPREPRPPSPFWERSEVPLASLPRSAMIPERRRRLPFRIDQPT